MRVPATGKMIKKGSANTFWFSLNWCQLKSIPFHGLLTDSNQIIGGIKEKLIFLQIQHIVHLGRALWVNARFMCINSVEEVVQIPMPTNLLSDENLYVHSHEKR